METVSQSERTPLGFFVQLSDNFRNQIEQIEFSKYVSGGQGITLQRQILVLPSADLSNNIQREISKLEEGEELAVHSNIYIKNEHLCLPIVDFTFSTLDDNAERVCKRIQEHLDAPLFIYYSGRSYHGYALKLLKLKEWYKYLGLLLLLNPPKHPYEYIDSRWIGHSLEHSFSALRLSHNSHYYVQKPEFVKVFY